CRARPSRRFHRSCRNCSGTTCTRRSSATSTVAIRGGCSKPPTPRRSPTEPERSAQPRRSLRLACLSARFSFSALPAFLLFVFLGDLSAIRSRLMRFSGERSRVCSRPRDCGGEMSGRRARDDEVAAWREEGWALIEGLVDTAEIDSAVRDLRYVFPKPEKFFAVPVAP